MEDYSGWILRKPIGRRDSTRIFEGDLIKFEKLDYDLCILEEDILLTDLKWNAIGYLNFERFFEEEGKVFAEYVMKTKLDFKKRREITNAIKKTYKNE